MNRGMNTPQTASRTDNANSNLLLKNENELLKKEINYLNEQIAWFKRQIFGQRSEKLVSTKRDVHLEFDGFDNLKNSEQEETQTIPEHKRKKVQRKGGEKLTFPDDLPVEEHHIDISEEEKKCPETGLPLIKIGEEITNKLAHKPGSYFIKRIIRPKYAFPKKASEEGIRTAELPDSLLPRCCADESFLAEVLTKKFADHLPLYRISEILGREGIYISRQLLSQWVVRIGTALKPLHEVMVKKILKSGNVFADEVPLDLLVKGNGKVHQAYMWTIVGGNSSDPPYRAYNFRLNRKHENIYELLKGYRGVLHSDKYGAYEVLAARKQITWCPCWSHIRRKFEEAESGDLKFREWVLEKIQELFMLEREAWKASEEEKLKVRQEQEVPIIDELIAAVKAKLIAGKVLPKSKFRTALGYFIGLIPYLKNYTEHPYARLDNNVAERAIRPLVIGRKNWLFVGSPKGGEAMAIILSLVQTCRALKVNPREYLEDVFRRIMSHNYQKLDELLPDKWIASRKEANP